MLFSTNKECFVFNFSFQNDTKKISLENVFFRTLHYLDKMTIVENIIFIKDIKEKKMSRQIKIYSKRLHCEDNVDEECDKTKFHKFIFTDISHFGGIFILKTKKVADILSIQLRSVLKSQV